MAEGGSGLVTILFTDLVGSTELLSRAGDEEAQRIFRAHRRLLSDAVATHGGHEVKWLGDGLMVGFPSAAAAVGCAVAMQQASRRPVHGERLAIRVGLSPKRSKRSPWKPIPRSCGPTSGPAARRSPSWSPPYARSCPTCPRRSPSSPTRSASASWTP